METGILQIWWVYARFRDITAMVEKQLEKCMEHEEKLGLYRGFCSRTTSICWGSYYLTIIRKCRLVRLGALSGGCSDCSRHLGEWLKDFVS